MSDVALCHNEGIVAYPRDAILVDGAVDDHVLADYVVVSDNYKTVVALPAEVLRRGGYDAPVIKPVVLSDPCTREDAYMRADVTAVSYHNIAVDKRKGVYRDVFTYFSIRMDEGEWADFRHGFKF